MKPERQTIPNALARKLVLDELFDLSLYKALREMTTGTMQRVLDELIVVEMKHFTFWRDFFEIPVTDLDLGRRVKLWVIMLACRLFGVHTMHLVLEAIEVYGVRKYLKVWDTYQGGPLGQAVRGIIEDELKHEDVVVTGVTDRTIDPERVRNLLFGLNDGLVEILGAVSGFFGAFDNAVTVLMASLTVAVAGSFSMAAGAYVASSSENEMRKTEREKKRFLGEGALAEEKADRPFSTALLVGGSYFAGATVPVFPVLVGAKHAVFSFMTAGSVIIVVSMVPAFLSGMDIRKRVLTNAIIIAIAVGFTYAIGLVAKNVWGISL